MKIAIVNHDDFSIARFRRTLLSELLADGHEVHVICGAGPHLEEICTLGVTHVPLDFPRFITPRADLRATYALWRIFRSNRYDLVHLFQQKIIVFGAIAAWAAGIPRVFVSSTGISTIAERLPGWRVAIARVVLKNLYRVALPLATRVLYQNPEDQEWFCSAGLVPRKKTVIVKGSGVDLREFSPEAVDVDLAAELDESLGGKGRLRVVMVARAVFLKGVREFIQASRIVEALRPSQALFVLLGGTEPGNIEALSEAEIRMAQHPGFRWVGWSTHVREYLYLTDIAVLPSYREGTPRALLEAMAMGKPLVTTDAPGCRNVIEDGRNGYMVPVGEAEPVAAAVIRLMDNAAARRLYGLRSRQKVEEEFEARDVADRIIRVLYGLPRVSKPRRDHVRLAKRAVSDSVS